MLPVQQPDLASMFGQFSVGPTVVGYDRQQMANQNNAFNLQQAQAEEQRAAQKFPLDLEAATQLARQRRLESDLAEKGQPLKLNKLQYDAQEAEYKDMDRFGQALEQWGSIAEANGGAIPLELQGRMPKELAAMFSQPNGWKQAKAAGTAMRENSKQWLSQQSKQGSAEDIAALKAQQAADAHAEKMRQADLDRVSRERIAAQRIDAARKLLTDKRATASDKKSLEQYAQDLFRQANELELYDPRAAQIVRARGDEIVKKVQSIKAAGATPRVDLDRSVLQEAGILPPPQQGTGASAPTTAPSADSYAGFKIK